MWFALRNKHHWYERGLEWNVIILFNSSSTNIDEWSWRIIVLAGCEFSPARCMRIGAQTNQRIVELIFRLACKISNEYGAWVDTPNFDFRVFRSRQNTMITQEGARVRFLIRLTSNQVSVSIYRCSVHSLSGAFPRSPNTTGFSLRWGFRLPLLGLAARSWTRGTSSRGSSTRSIHSSAISNPEDSSLLNELSLSSPFACGSLIYISLSAVLLSTIGETL